MASRGMGAISPSKMPKGKKIKRKDHPQDVTMYQEGGKVGLYENKLNRIKIVGQNRNKS